MKLHWLIIIIFVLTFSTITGVRVLTDGDEYVVIKASEFQRMRNEIEQMNLRIEELKRTTNNFLVADEGSEEIKGALDYKVPNISGKTEYKTGELLWQMQERKR